MIRIVAPTTAHEPWDILVDDQMWARVYRGDLIAAILAVVQRHRPVQFDAPPPVRYDEDENDSEERRLTDE